MTFTDGKADGRTAGTDGALVRRLKLLAVCLLLTGAALSLDPPLIVGDTKIDLTVNPTGFLERALYLWDPSYFGQLQNQAYGYFFPNGPFHALLIALDMPEWMVQRTWMAVLLCAAFLGTVKVAEALGIGTLNTRIVAGTAYALAPRVLTLVSYNSAELQPMLLLPWILLPLIHGSRRGTPPMRAAMLSALAFLLCGGTNAASELAVLVVPLLYLLTRAPGPRKRRLLLWWLAALFCVSFWWLVPLLIMGRYVWSFMPYTEDAATTTGITSLTNALRGASNWMGYVPSSAGRPALPAGAELSTEPWLVAATAVVAGLGLAGLIWRRTPERLFLLTSVLAGTAIVVAGYTGQLSGPLGPTVQGLLDGVLAPFRNIHKFDALIRFPLVLGLAQLPVAIGSDAAARRGGPLRALSPPPGTAYRATAGVCAVAFAATLTPIATVGIATPGGFERIPAYWYDATRWIDEHSTGGTTMAVPGSARGEYQWGRPMDEPMQPLLDSAWTNQQIIPWGSAGASRLTQEIDQRISSGRGSEGLARALARMGVTHLLVRNDLQRDGNNGGWPARVHQALEDSPGIVRRASFGPAVGDDEAVPASRWYDQPYQALEVYEVRGAAPTVGTVPADGTMRVTGGPESLLTLAEQGALPGDRPVIIGDDPGAEDIAPEDTVAADSARRREIVYSDVRRNTSATLTADEDYERDAPAPDISDPAWDGYTAVAEDSGIASVTASSTEAGADASPGTRDPGRSPFAALDEAPDTSWRSSSFTGAEGQWLEVGFEEPREVGTFTVAFERLAGEPPPSRISIITDAGRTTAAVADDDGPQEFTAPEGETERLRIRVDELAYEPEYRFGTRVGITSVEIPGLEASRSLAVPVPEGGAGSFFFTGSTGTVPGCMEGSRAWVCNPGLEVQGEDAVGMSRTFDVGAEAAGRPSTITGRVVAVDPRDLENAANRAGGYPKVTSSSTSVGHPAAIGRNAFDGDDATVWYPDPQEDAPSLEVDLGREREIGGLKVEFPRPDAVGRPIRMTVDTGTTVREAWLDGDGWVGFDPVEADELTLTFEPPEGQPLEVSRIALPDTDPLEPVEGGSARTSCGLGPVLRVNGERVDTRISSGTLEDKLAGRPLGFESCEAVSLEEGTATVGVEPGRQYQVRSVLVGPDGGPGAGGDRDGVETAEVSAVNGWGRSERSVDVAVDEDSYLVVNENFNEGWEAVLGGGDGAPLEPVRLDGWKQAWRLPAGTSGTVTMTYTPDAPYHAALGIGAALALLVGVLAVKGRVPVPGRLRRRARAAAPTALLPDALPARIPRAPLALLGPLYGAWVAGAAGAAVMGGVLLAVWWLGRAPSKNLKHAKPGRPTLGGTLLRWTAGPWTILAFLTAAGVSTAAGTYLAMYLPFHDVSGLLSDPLRGWVAQLLCLPALARLVLALGEAPPTSGMGPGADGGPGAAAEAEPEPAEAGREVQEVGA
ncbi:alpha-(1-_3)-arabinofuranosyltransferase family protein [Nocardiopsis sp. RSe5-2]|uniref:Alpha-(1->3)-arabinofuranosyltransferase family protein n=1 Tax=Nocardiopsis endophytica TaxID=3018445 RepID=A0ABT4UB78_9ACTN|nr:alpha-(1->3)-arabinofuranosyltransferase family protein [Nocardiopsis endophytica]MDA2813996.1 alpha-(1->3)-arabinofuranosyltransferase family protein [Nocardiopsis endophytica]